MPPTDAPGEDAPAEPDDPRRGASDDRGAAEQPLEELETQLCLLASRLAAGECEFLRLLAEFDARDGWAAWGIRSTAHWLSWKCGMRLGAARERVRVARALTALPLLRDTFARGELSYCKVRAVTRVATPATETDLVELARGATGAQTERIVRAWRTTMLPELAASRHARRGLSRAEDDDGSVVYRLRLAPEEAAVFDRALAMVRADLDRTEDAKGHGGDRQAANPQAAAPQAAERLAAERRGAERRGAERRGAEQRAAETPEESRLAREVTDDPPSARAAADAVVQLAHAFLAGSAKSTSTDSYRVIVHVDQQALAEAMGQHHRQQPRSTPHTEEAAPPATPPPNRPGRLDNPGPPDDPGRPDNPGGPDYPDSTADDDFRSVMQRAAATRPPAAVIEDGAVVSASTVLRLMCHCPVQLMASDTDGRPLQLGRSARHASAAQRLALQRRDDGCRFPGCSRTQHLVPHHVWWWSRGGSTDLDNLLLLCGAHHRAVHEVGYTVAALGDGRFRFSRPDGRVILGAPGQGPADAADLPEPAPGVSITPTWGGEQLDLDWLISGLAASALIRAGRSPATIAYAEQGAALRAAVGWPLPPPERAA